MYCRIVIPHRHIIYFLMVCKVLLHCIHLQNGTSLHNFFPWKIVFQVLNEEASNTLHLLCSLWNDLASTQRLPRCPSQRHWPQRTPWDREAGWVCAGGPRGRAPLWVCSPRSESASRFCHHQLATSCVFGVHLCGVEIMAPTSWVLWCLR